MAWKLFASRGRLHLKLFQPQDPATPPCSRIRAGPLPASL
jgi:hypothetical protein